MDFNGYKCEMTDILRNVVEENDIDLEENDIQDIVYNYDLTGNMCGSYYCNAYKAQQAIKDLLVDPSFWDEVKSYDLEDLVNRAINNSNWETVDVIARELAVSYIFADDFQD